MIVLSAAYEQPCYADSSRLLCLQQLTSSLEPLQYTIRNVSDELDKALRERARKQGCSLNEVALEALRRDVGLSSAQPKRRDLSSFSGSWIEDPEVDKALDNQRIIDGPMWK